MQSDSDDPATPGTDSDDVGLGLPREIVRERRVRSQPQFLIRWHRSWARISHELPAATQLHRRARNGLGLFSWADSWEPADGPVLAANPALLRAFRRRAPRPRARARRRAPAPAAERPPPPRAAAELVSRALEYRFDYVAPASPAESEHAAAAAEEAGGPVVRRHSRRRANPAAWQRNNRPRRQFAAPGPRCRCPWACFDTFRQAQRRLLQRRLGSCSSVAEHRRFLANWIHVQPRPMPAAGAGPALQLRPPRAGRQPRRYTAQYFLPHPVERGHRVRVCQSAFCTFLGISRKQVANLNAHRAEHGLMAVPVDMRGRHGRQVYECVRVCVYACVSVCLCGCVAVWLCGIMYVCVCVSGSLVLNC
jgi:hypothetical protein